tara:strand:- start:189 stop:974 length:786 start_codon:yes stop_codon:yes gene_type:complete
MKTLQQIGEELGSRMDGDKHKHHFQNITHLMRYEQYFSEFREEEFNILEIGASGGHSLLVWQEYFPNAKIYAVDVQPACARHTNDRITVRIGSQIDEEFMKSVGDQAGNFKIIVDDGSHVGEHMMKTLKIMWEYLSPEGYYVFEDTGTTRTINPLKRWPGYKEGGFVDIAEKDYDGDNYDIGKSRHLIDDWIIEELQAMDSNLYNEKNFETTLGGYPLDFIHFYSCLQIMKKAKECSVDGVSDSVVYDQVGNKIFECEVKE